MSLLSRISRSPIPFDPDAAADLAAGFADLPAPLRDLMAATAGCSPYLKGLMLREGDWLRDIAGQKPEAALEALLDAPAEVPVDQLGPALRQAKRRGALLSALCDLGGIWPLETVTGALTRLADRAVDLCLQRLVAEEIRRGKLPGQGPGDAATAGGMVALAWARWARMS